MAGNKSNVSDPGFFANLDPDPSVFWLKFNLKVKVPTKIGYNLP